MGEKYNSLFILWLQEWLREASLQGNERKLQTYGKALKNLKKYPLPLVSAEETQKISGIGKLISLKLGAKLKKYLNDLTKHSAPPNSSLHQKVIAPVEVDSEEVCYSKNNRKRKKDFIPAYRSGAYGIILGLFYASPSELGLTKAEVLKEATPHCSSIGSPSEQDCFGSIWSGMKTLCDKEFVKKTGRPARFQLTVQGFELAKFFLELDSLTTQNEEWFKLNSKSSVEESRQPEADLLVEDSDCCIILDSPLPKYKNTHNMESETLVIIDPINKLEDENLLSECEKVIGKLEDPNLTINTSSETITKNIFMDNKDLNYRKHQYLNLQQISNTGICLLVDNRENFSKKDRRCILEELQRRGVECVPRALPLGDFTWIAQFVEEYMLGFIIERKRMDDLVASIFDSRFIEQQSRLAASGLSHVVYLVEDYGRMEAQKLPASSIRKAMRRAWKSNFTLHRTKNIQETIEYLVTVHHKLHEYLTTRRQKIPATSYDLFKAHCAKTKIKTLSEIFARQLVCIRNVTAVIAAAIVSHYPTLRSLLDAYEACTCCDGKRNLLKDIPCANGSKVGPRISETVYQLYCV